MAVIESKDEELGKLVYTEKCVVIKYYTKDCENCKTLNPVFEKFSNTEKYEKILFIRLNANENPVAQQFIKTQELPFMVSYKNGLLIESKTIASEKEMKHLLDNL